MSDDQELEQAGTGDELEHATDEVRRRVQGFADEMRDRNIHVGLGNPGRCVTCGQPWPCPSAGDAGDTIRPVTDEA